MLLTCVINTSTIQIRLATLDDLADTLQLDHRVSFEFFKPLYQTYYANFPNGKNPDYFLNAELLEDEQAFLSAIYGENFSRLLVAQDTITTSLVGLLLFHKEDTLLTLDLLLIDKEYRHQGVGRKLVQSALTIFEDITSCEVYPLRFGNDTALRFYESLGFINCGLGPVDEINTYGVSYADMYYFYKLIMRNQPHQAKKLRSGKSVRQAAAGRAG
jgi:ribosomal protein S18 acetylase RimI-like enzyme